MVGARRPHARGYWSSRFPWYEEFKNGLLLASLEMDAASYMTQVCDALRGDFDYTNSIDQSLIAACQCST